MELKCIRDKCRCYWNSDNYFETCQLVSKYILLDTKCQIQNKKEELVCTIAKLTKELEGLEELKELVKNNQ